MSESDQPQQIEITAHPRNAATVREHVREAAIVAGFTDPALSDIEIAVGEAVTNAILYGSPSDTSRIVVSFWFVPSQRSFQVEVRDEGHGFDPGRVRDGDDTDALGGRGIRLMRALMDSVLLHYTGSGMLVRLTKSRAPDTP